MQVKAAAKKQTLLDASMKVFAEKGYHYATVEEIAREAGVAKGSVHAYFENKLDILLTLLLSFWQTINETNTARLACEQDPVRALKAVFATFQDLLLSDARSLYWGKILQEGLPELHTHKSEALRDKQRSIEREGKKLAGTIDAVIRDGQEKGRLKKTVKAAVLRQILGGSSQLLVYGLFMQVSGNAGIGYDAKDVQNALDQLIDMFVV